MKVLWFEPIGQPSRYNHDKNYAGTWQDSLERIVRIIPEIELYIAFLSDNNSDITQDGNVTYIPIKLKWRKRELKGCYYWNSYRDRVIPKALEIVSQYKPDIIQVFGTEWPFGQIAKYTEIPVVAHIQGAIVPYQNAEYPPSYSFWTVIMNNLCNPKHIAGFCRDKKSSLIRKQVEVETWKAVSYYMGRTGWDRALANVMHPGCHYYHVNEALRNSFSQDVPWKGLNNQIIKIVSIGFHMLKGPDMMLKTAKILTDLNIGFDWDVIGPYDKKLIKLVEHKTKAKYSECHVHFLGKQDSVAIAKELKSASIYCHCAYIENSPNSICEAQMIGVPVVSTNVGGIASLVRDGKDGILVPANDPWQMAYAIIALNKDKVRMKQYSENAKAFAHTRHDDENIKKELLDAYYQILSGIKR